MPHTGVSSLTHRHGNEFGTVSHPYAEPPLERPLRLREFATRSWVRVAGIRYSRGQVSDRLYRFLLFASRAADEGTEGTITDVDRWMRTYCAHVARCPRTFWSHLTEATEGGWIRKAQGSSHGITAIYQLQLPMGLLPGNLPGDLADQVPETDPDAWEHPDEDASYGRARVADVGPVRVAVLRLPTRKARALKDACAAGKAAFGRIVEAPVASAVDEETELHMMPLYAKARYYPVLSTNVGGGVKRTNRTSRPVRPGRRPARSDEIADGMGVLARCRPEWLKQRAARGGLAVDEALALAPDIALALRRTTPGRIVDMLTDRVRSAENLPAVLAARLWEFIRGTHDYDYAHHQGPDVDDTGSRHAAMLAEMDAYAEATRETTHAHAEGLREYVALAQAERDLARAEEEAAAARIRERYPVPVLREPEHLHYEAQPPADRSRPDAAAATRAAAVRRARAERAARAREDALPIRVEILATPTSPPLTTVG